MKKLLLLVLFGIACISMTSCGLVYFGAAAAAGGGGGGGAKPVKILTSETLPSGQEKYAYIGVQFTASGGTAPYTWATVGGNPVPTGLLLNSSGYLSGTPTAMGVYNFTVQVTDSASKSVTKAVTCVIDGGLKITTSTPLTGGLVGILYTATFQAANGVAPYTWTLESGNLPDNLTLSADGTLSGTPAKNGPFNFTIGVTDNDGKTDSKAFSVTMGLQTLTITSTLPITPGKVGYVYAGAQFQANGGLPPYSWTTIGGGQLPAGLTLNSGGYLAGTPTLLGNYSFTIQVMDNASLSANKPFWCEILGGITITTASLLNEGRVGFPYSATFAADNGTGMYLWTLNVGSFLPPGFNLSNAGALSGAPTTDGNFNFTIDVADTDNKTASKTFNIAIQKGLAITTSSLPDAEFAVAYAATLSADNGATPYTWSPIGGALPTGLSLYSNGSIIGAPSQQGNFSITVQVTDNYSSTVSKTLSLYVKETSAIVIISTNPSVLGSGGISRITWKSTRNGDYTIKAGGGGNFDCGTEIISSVCAAGIPVITMVTEGEIPDNSATDIWIYVLVSGTGEMLCSSTTLWDDRTAPASAITNPVNGQALGGLPAIEGNASDTGGSIVIKVEITILDNTSLLYWSGVAFDCASKVYFQTAGTDLWSYNSSGIALTNAHVYKIQSRATDNVSNVETAGAGVYFTADTSLPVINIISAIPSVLGAGMNSSIIWQCDVDGNYRVEVGGNGTPATGTLVENGSCTSGSPVTSTVYDSDLTQNTSNNIYVIVTDLSLRVGHGLVQLTDDHVAPGSAVTFPGNGSSVNGVTNITGTAADNGGSVVSAVRVSIHNGTQYYNGSSFSSVSEVLLAAVGTETWGYDSTAIAWQNGVMYRIRSYATDAVGNTQGTAGVCYFTYNISAEPPSKVTGPIPANNENDVAVGTSLSWTPATEATGYDVYLGPLGNMAFVGYQTGTSYTPPVSLNYFTTYMWQINSKGPGGQTAGDLWTFRTIIEAPAAAVLPSPADGALNQLITAALDWENCARAVGYYVYFGTISNPAYNCTVADSTWNPGALAYDTIYYWKIVSYNIGGNTSSAIWSFRTKMLEPNQVIIPSPADNATGVSASTVLDWENATRAQGYYVFFGTSSNPPYNCSVTDSTWNPGTLSYLTTYYWKIIAYNTGGNASTTIWKFETRMQEPDAAANPVPAHLANNVDIAVTLDWDNSARAAGYYVFFGANPSPAYQTTVVNSSWNAGSLSYETTYYWQVIAYNAGGNASTAVWQFTTKRQAPDTALISSPADNAAGIDINASLFWFASARADGYYVYFGTNSNPPYVTATAGTSYTPATMSCLTTYYWKIIAYNTGGNASTTIWKFQTRMQEPDAAANPVPAHLANNVDIAVTLDWDNSARAAGYYVFFGANPSPPYQTTVANSSWNAGSLSYETTYYWSIISYNAGGNTSAAVWQFTTKRQAPDAPTAVSPPVNGTDISITPTLVWGAALRADGYYVFFGNSSNPPYATATTGITYDPGLLLNYTSYYWKIIAYNSGGNSSATIWQFKTIIEAPGAFAYIGPSDNAINISVTPQLQWNNSSRAVNYDVYMGTSYPPTLWTSNISNTYYSPSTNLAWSTMYYWQIVAKNAGGTYDGSIWSFTTAMQPPATPGIIYPFNGATNVNLDNGSIDWTDCARAAGYYVYYGTTYPPVNSATTASSIYSITTLAGFTTYYWRIVAYNSGGNTSSADWYFRTGFAPEAGFVNNSQTSGYAPLSVQFLNNSSWEATWAWDFDCNGTVDDVTATPTHVYNTPGVYTVRLTITGVFGGNDTEIKTDYVRVYSPTPTCTITSPSSGNWYNSSFTVYGNASDFMGIQYVQYSGDNSSWYMANFSDPNWDASIDIFTWPWNFDGDKIVYVRAYNGAIYSATQMLTFHRDCSPPWVNTNVNSWNGRMNAGSDISLYMHDGPFDCSAVEAFTKVFELGFSTNLVYQYDWEDNGNTLVVKLIGPNNEDVLKSSYWYELNMEGVTDLAGNPIQWIDATSGAIEQFQTQDYTPPKITSIAFGMNSGAVDWWADPAAVYSEGFAPILFNPAKHLDCVSITFDKLMRRDNWTSCEIQYENESGSWVNLNLSMGFWNAGAMQWSWDNTVLTLTLYDADEPNGVRYGYGKTYQCRFNSLSDESGNNLNNLEFTLQFMDNEAGIDTQPPVVLGIYPYYDGQTDGTISPRRIAISLNEAVDPSTVNITNVILMIDCSWATCDVYVSGGDDGKESGSTIYILYGSAFPLDSTITITIQNLADLNGNYMSSPYSISFTTPSSWAVDPPEIIAHTPLDNQQRIGMNTWDMIGCIFDQKRLSATTLNMSSLKVYEKTTGKVIKGFNFRIDDPRLVEDTFSIENRLQWGNIFENNTTYVVEVAGVCNLAGDPMTPASWEFTMGDAWMDNNGDGRHDNPAVDYTPTLSSYEPLGRIWGDTFLDNTGGISYELEMQVRVSDCDFQNGDIIVSIETPMGVFLNTSATGWGYFEYRTPEGSNDYSKIGATGLVNLTVHVYECNAEELTYTLPIYVCKETDMPYLYSPSSGSAFSNNADITFQWTNNITAYEESPGIAFISQGGGDGPALMVQLALGSTSFTLPAGALPPGTYTAVALESDYVPGYMSEGMGVPINKYTMSGDNTVVFTIYDTSLGIISGTVKNDYFVNGTYMALIVSPDLLNASGPNGPTVAGMLYMTAPGTYTVYNLPDNTYYVYVYNEIDGIQQGGPSKSEPGALYMNGSNFGLVTISGGNNVSNVDITIYPTFYAVSGGESSTYVYVAGQLGTVWRCDIPTASWTLLNSGTTECLFGAFADETHNLIWFCGTSGLVLRYDELSDTFTQTYLTGASDLNGIWGDSSRIWTVGKGGYISVYDYAVWTQEFPPTSEDLFCVGGFNTPNIFAGGANGVILRNIGPGWIMEPVSTFENVNGILYDNFMTGMGYCAGANGQTARNVGNWMPFMPPITPSNLFGITQWYNNMWLYACGDYGTLLEYNPGPGSWTQISTGSPMPLYGIWGRNFMFYFVWTVGFDGTVLRYDGSIWTSLSPYP
jgi:hypothetical protein